AGSCTSSGAGDGCRPMRWATTHAWPNCTGSTATAWPHCRPACPCRAATRGAACCSTGCAGSSGAPPCALRGWGRTDLICTVWVHYAHHRGAHPWLDSPLRGMSGRTCARTLARLPASPGRGRCLIRLAFSERGREQPGPATSSGADLARVLRRNKRRTQCRAGTTSRRSEEHTSELQSREKLVCRLLRGKTKEDRARAARTRG